MIVFVVSGLWHGASWTFVLWGGLHGFYYLLHVWTEGIRDKGAQLFHLEAKPVLKTFIGALITFVLVCFAWVFFRANSISDAFLLIGSLVRLGPSTASVSSTADAASGSVGLSAVLAPWGNAVGALSARNPGLELVLSCALIVLLALVDWAQAFGVQRPAWMRDLVLARKVWIRWAVYLILALAIMNLGVREGTPFVYMQF
jgi:hypothetical protein